MIQNLRRKMLFFVSILFTGLLTVISAVSNHTRSGYLKEESLFIPSASADIAAWTGTDAMTDCGCGGCSGAGCLPAGTIISTPSGNRNIESIIVGDFVFGYDPTTKQIGEYSVVNLTSKGEIKESALIVIDHENGKIILTDGHLLHLEGGISEDNVSGFVEARNIKAGDALTMENGTKSIVTAVYEGQKNQPIYNFEVGKVHTYIANGVVVHNDGS